MSEKPLYWKDPDGKQNLRASWHDYHSRQIYMITVTKAPSAPLFGYLNDAMGPESAEIVLTDCGLIVSREINVTPDFNPEIRIINQIVMPDHFHVLLFVTRPIKKVLGDVIRAMKASITGKIRRLIGKPDIEVLTENFNDRLMLHEGQVDAASKYIDENPYRLSMRRRHPEFFKRVNNFAFNGMQLQAYGNMLLLTNPFKMQVVVHSGASQESKDADRSLWIYNAANGGVLVSPFISKAEKEIRNEADKYNGRIILVTMDRFPERYKPTGVNFKLCSEGRLLIVSAAKAYEDLSHSCSGAVCENSKSLTRQKCQFLNYVAAQIAGSH